MRSLVALASASKICIVPGASTYISASDCDDPVRRYNNLIRGAARSFQGGAAADSSQIKLAQPSCTRLEAS